MPVFAYIGQDGRRLLESALAEPAQTYGGRYLHRTIHDKAAALLRSLIKNHPFVDGNKRLALTATIVFLALNHWLFFAPRHEAVERCLQIARTEGNVEVREIASWMRPRAVNLHKFAGMDREKRDQILTSMAPHRDAWEQLTAQVRGMFKVILGYTDDQIEELEGSPTEGA